jgi:hypothetical protein
MLILNTKDIKKRIECNKKCSKYLVKRGFSPFNYSTDGTFYYVYNYEIELTLLNCPFYLKHFMKWSVIDNGKQTKS